jgi:HAD superfamily hydrolase (TIGR01509 family)
MPSRPFDAVIFDLDGTLIDTETLCNETGVEACQNLGYPVSMAFFETLAGIHDLERARLIGREVGAEIDTARFYAEWDRLCAIRFQAGIPLKPGAVELLTRLAGLDLPMAVATSSRRQPAMDKITMAGLAPWFRTVVTFDDVTAAKPAPDPYLLAAGRLATPPSRCIAFEDSETGARSAFAAGLTVVQIPDIHPTDGQHAHHVAPSLLAGARMAGLIDSQVSAM